MMSRMLRGPKSCSYPRNRVRTAVRFGDLLKPGNLFDQDKKRCRQGVGIRFTFLLEALEPSKEGKGFFRWTVANPQVSAIFWRGMGVPRRGDDALAHGGIAAEVEACANGFELVDEGAGLCPK